MNLKHIIKGQLHVIALLLNKYGLNEVTKLSLFLIIIMPNNNNMNSFDN